MNSIIWITNVPNNKQEHLELTYTTTTHQYQYLDKFQILNLNKMKEIPIDYDMEIAAPISILKHMDNQGYILTKDPYDNIIKYQIKGMMKGNIPHKYQYGIPSINNKMLYPRILIQKYKG